MMIGNELFGYITEARQIRRHLFGYSNPRVDPKEWGVCMSKFQLPALNSLKFFEAAARHQSIKQACDELHVTHSAVSRHIQRVERLVLLSHVEKWFMKARFSTDSGLRIRSRLDACDVARAAV